MRHEFSAATRRAAWARSGGYCEFVYVRRYGKDTGRPDRVERCNLTLYPGRFVYDHIDPDWFSGCNDLSNCQVICELCNKVKTRKDAKAIAKSKRIIDKAIHARAVRHALPFGKHSGLKKKIGGQIVDRATGRPVTPYR